MIKFYYNGAPNPMKVALLLEEAGIPYEPFPIDTRSGDQHKPEYTAINPNAKAPAIVDDGVAIFDSNAILLYLAEKHGQFLPSDTKARGPMLSWLMFVASGIGPYSGQSVHFKHFAPEPKEYAVNRYDFEADRHYRIIDERLAANKFMMGEEYTIVDMAIWGWARLIPRVLSENAMDNYPNLKRLMGEINARPAAERAEALPSKHTFKAEMDDAARQHMFPQNARIGA